AASSFPARRASDLSRSPCLNPRPRSTALLPYTTLFRSQQVAGLVAEHALDRRAGVAEHAVFPNDRHDVRRVLDEGAEVLLALAQRRFSARAIDGGGKHVRSRAH